MLSISLGFAAFHRVDMDELIKKTPYGRRYLELCWQGQLLSPRPSITTHPGCSRIVMETIRYGRLTQYLLASQWTLSFRRARSLLLHVSHHVHQCTACCPFNLTVDKYLVSERVSKISIGLDFPVVQWLTLCTPNAGALGSIPGQGTRKSCMWQLRLDTAELIHH